MKAILFDFDGVLTTDKSGSASVLNDLSRRLKLPIDLLRREYYKFNEDLLCGKYTHRDIWTIFCENIGYDIPFDCLIESYRHTPIDVRMISLVRELKKSYKIGLITDNKIDRIEEILSFFHISNLFDAVSVSAECHCCKSGSEIFTRTMTLLNVQPHECIFIDNSKKNLVVPAALGVATVFFDDQSRDIEQLKRELSGKINQRI